MHEDQREDGVIEGLQEHYHNPPPYPKEKIEAGIIGRSRKVERYRIAPRFRIPTALAASLVLFLGGVVVGRATDRVSSEPATASTSASNAAVGIEGSVEGYTVSWF